VDIGGETRRPHQLHAYRSVNLAKEAIEEIRALIAKRYGDDNLPETPHVYKTKSKNAAGSARGDPPDLGRAHPRGTQGAPDAGAIQAV